MTKTYIPYLDLPSLTCQYDQIRDENSSCVDSMHSNQDTDQNRKSLTLFDLSSHKRARDAIEFGLSMRDHGYHVFVLGEDRSGRMSSTLDYLKQYVEGMKAPNDWVYLNNFEKSYAPLPFSLPAGQAVVFQQKLEEFLDKAYLSLIKTFSEESYTVQIQAVQSQLQEQLNEKIHQVQTYATENGFNIVQAPDGFSIEPILVKKTKKKEKDLEYEMTEEHDRIISEIKESINRIEHLALEANLTIEKKVRHLNQIIAKKRLAFLFQKFRADYQDMPIATWIDSLKGDILDNLELFAAVPSQNQPLEGMPEQISEPFIFHKSERYHVNILVNHQHATHGRIILEPNPGYEQLFGSIKYSSNAMGSHETNFTMIRKGALHSANGGILVLRADALAKNPDVWEMLKAALRDKVIRIEERYRDNMIPMLDAPSPTPIPLDIQVFLIASPFWYYTFFFNDPEFRTYFKIKADIEEDMLADEGNIKTYRALLQQTAMDLFQKEIDQDALDYLLAYSARWTENRHRLTSRYEQITDIILEAFVCNGNKPTLTADAVRYVLKERRVRNARAEDRSFEDILSGQILIDTDGQAIGQINGLTVLNTGDHQFGLPSRISARSYAGDLGVLNIERMTEMAGPIQQKGAMILEGFLNGLLAQKFPLSYSCSLTFEQSYVDVDGDSASMAEVIAILSSLSGIPVRQDIAITGSMNQFGVTQPIGGVHFKVESFHKLCCARGLTGQQGVIIPRSNVDNLTLRENVIQDIQEKRFFIWPVDTVFEALELMLSTSSGVHYDHHGAITNDYPFYHFEKDSILYKAEQVLKKYHAYAHATQNDKKDK